MSNKTKIFMTFRARLMLLLTACLLLTIGIVFALEYWSQNSINNAIIDHNKEVEAAIDDGFGDIIQAVSIATRSLGSEDLIYNVVDPEDMPKTVEAIIVADKDGNVIDSSLKELVQNIKVINVPKDVNALELSGNTIENKKRWIMSGDPIVGA